MPKVQPYPETATAPSAEQRVRLVLEVEEFQDIEDGTKSLTITTDELACEPTAPARVRSYIAAAHAELDAMERLVNEYEARDTLRAIIAEHELIVFEDDLSDISELDRVAACFSWQREDGRTVVIVPAGQDPIARTNAVAKLVTSLQTQAVQA